MPYGKCGPVYHFKKFLLMRNFLKLAIMDGTELRMTNLFAKLYNATTELIVDEPKQWGTIYDNWTGIGVVGNVAIDEADIGLGLLIINQYLFCDNLQFICKNRRTVYLAKGIVVFGSVEKFCTYRYNVFNANTKVNEFIDTA